MRLRAIRENFDPREDFILLPGTSQDTLDFTSYKMNLGSKMIIDATANASRAPRSPNTAPTNINAIKQSDSRIQNAAVFEGTMLAVQVASDGREILEKMVNSAHINGYSLIVAVSADVPLDDPVLFLWGPFTRFDCARDTFFQRATLKNGHPLYEGPLFIDATWKQGYPEPLQMTDSVIRTVNTRWKEYGIF